MSGNKKCWVTVAVEPNDGIKALVLAKSLRQYMTKHSLAIFLSHLIPHQLWAQIEKTFDVIYRLDKKWTSVKNVSDETGILYGKISSFGLSHMDTIAFLHPNSMFIRNCDELLDKEGFHHKNFTESEISVFAPSNEIYSILMNSFLNEIPENQLLEMCLKDLKINQLEEFYNLKIDIQNGYIARNLSEFGIVVFEGIHPMQLGNIENCNGQLEKAIYSMWTSFSNDFTTEKDLKNHKDSVAIIGMSCRYPGANSVAEFWNLLDQGIDAMGPAPSGRWTSDKCPLMAADTSEFAEAGFLKCPIEEFDGSFFGISATDLEQMDPQQRITLQLAWEALEDATINPLLLNGSHTGVFGGLWRQDYSEALQRSDNGVNENGFLRKFLGSSLGVLTGRISHFLGLTGPSIGTESGCSSSMVAVHMACNSLLKGETDLSLACGANLVIHPFNPKHMGNILAPDGRCKTFDETADGFGRADGIAVVVLKRYSDAMRDNDRIYSIIRGSAVVQEGASKSLGTPTKYCESLAMTLALKSASVSPADVSYVETHGTGTPLGDPLEISAVAQAYSHPLRETPLIIGSVKTNIGHTESCAGIAGLMKTVLSMQNESIPRHLHFNKLNPEINLNEIPAVIPLEPVPWTRTENKPRIAGVSSFGITGTDAHVIIQETPNPSSFPSLTKYHGINSTHPWHILKISAKTDSALAEYVEQWKTFLANIPPEMNLESICYTANVGRSDFSHRIAFVGGSVQQLLKNMKTTSQSAFVESLCRQQKEQPKIGFLFTGQGSQYKGMAKDLYLYDLTFKLHFDQCEQILRNKYNISLKESLWDENSLELEQSLYSQTCIFVIEYCMLKLWGSWGIHPSFVLGHSLGEFAAAVAAGILSFENALTLVAERSRLINALPEGKMLIIKESEGKTKELLGKASDVFKGKLDIAAINSEDQTVVAGDLNDIYKFAEFCSNNQVKATILKSKHAFHSQQMDPILKEYKKITESISYEQPNCTFISGMEGKRVKQLNSSYWVRHTREAVRFLDAKQAIIDQGCTMFLELGPQPILSAMMLSDQDGIKCFPSIRRQENDWSCLLSTLERLYLEGVNVDWKGFYQWSPVKKLTVPFYPFQNKPYWFPMQDKGSNFYHPLVGKYISNPTSTTIFSNSIKLTELSYLRDHVLGTEIVYPGAAFMEMCIAAGYAATQCTEEYYMHPTEPASISNFTIFSPLFLSEGCASELQTVVVPDDNGLSRITIYSKLLVESEPCKWIKHASATFSSYPGKAKNVETLQVLQKRMSGINSEKISNAYDKIFKQGFRFGPNFLTIKEMWSEPNINSLEMMNEVLFKLQISKKFNISKYILHPILPDAFLQAFPIWGFAASENNTVFNLQMPISVKNYTVFQRYENVETYMMHCKRLANYEDLEAVLYTLDGKLVAEVNGVNFIETSLESVLRVLESQKFSLPDMYREVWRFQLGSQERRVDIQDVICDDIFEDTYFNEMVMRHNKLTEPEHQFLNDSCHLNGLFIIKALLELGYEENLQSTKTFEELAMQFSVNPRFKGFLQYMFFELEKDGYFLIGDRENRDTLWIKQIVQFQNLGTLKDQIKLFNDKCHSFSPNEVKFVASNGRELANILRMKDSVPSISFHELSSSLSESRVAVHSNLLFDELLAKLLENVPGKFAENKAILRILEIGEGRNVESYTERMTTFMKNCLESYEYTYVQISDTSQFNDGVKDEIIHKMLDLSKDVCRQGFLPNYYDIVFSRQMISNTNNCTQKFQNMRTLVRPSGLVILTEHTTSNRSISLTTRILELQLQSDQFNPTDYHSEKLPQLLAQMNFKSVTCFPTYDNNISLIVGRFGSSSSNTSLCLPAPTAPNHLVWILFGNPGCKLTEYFTEMLEKSGSRVLQVLRGPSNIELNADRLVMNISSREAILNIFKNIQIDKYQGTIYLWGIDVVDTTENIIRPYFHICKSIVSCGLEESKLFCYTNGIHSIEDHVQNNPVNSPLSAMTICFQNEYQNSKCRVIDLDASYSEKEVELLEAYSELVKDDDEVSVAYRDRKRVVPRLNLLKTKSNQQLKFPDSDKIHLVLSSSNSIQNLRFGPLQTRPLQPHEFEIKVKAYSLNFRDIFAVLKPIKDFENVNQVGIDWAGEIIKIGQNVTKFVVGDRVSGTNRDDNGALDSHLIKTENNVVIIPQHQTYEEASTLPLASVTAYECLIVFGKLTDRDTVLIHTGSGGVGLVATQIALNVGARIVATAGSKRKRAFLRNIGVKYVFDSRNTDYGANIRKALNGAGVDIVVNTLTSPGFKEATLSACNEGARFIEISKWSIWTKDEMTLQRPDVEYNIIDVSKRSDEYALKTFTLCLKFLEKSGRYSLPYVKFDASAIREALTYMQKAKHIGKIVVVMPHSGSNIKAPMFNDMSTYIITGGLGGIGMQVCNWMLGSGAKHVALIGRHPPNKETMDELQKINSSGKNVFHMQFDIGNENECEQLFQTLECKELNLPVVRGVMHAAGVLSDGTFETQTWEKYQETFHPKINGAWNLHKMTLKYPLEHFVMFSSAVSLFGSIGQGNYAAANFYLDSLAHYRSYLGLPAHSIKWGQWGQVGLAAHLNLPFLKPISNLQGTTSLETIMNTQIVQTFVVSANLNAAKAMHGRSSYFREIQTSGDDLQQEIVLDKAKFRHNYDSATNDTDRLEIVTEFIRNATRQLLKMSAEETINDDDNFQDMGMDSLMMIEMKNVLQSFIGDRAKITASSVKDCFTVTQLSSRILQLLKGETLIPLLTREEFQQLIREDANLPIDLPVPEFPACLPTQVEKVLITGATGNLGPYILRDLSQRCNIKMIYCLVRGHANEVNKRIIKCLEENQLLKDTDMSKITVLAGSITMTKFGLIDEIYDSISKDIDAVVHLAVKSSFTDIYKRNESSHDDIRSINVFGTKEVLKFVCSTKLKILFHASSIVANAKISEDDTMCEEWVKEDDYDNFPNNAYPVSKFVAELLLKKAAMQLNLPLKVFRFPVIGGDSIRGHLNNYENNQLMLRMMGYLSLGFMPDVPFPFNILPADISSRLSLQLFFDDSSPYEVYNVYNPTAVPETDFCNIAEELDYKIEILDEDEFEQRFMSLERKDSILVHLIKETLSNKDTREILIKHPPPLLYAWDENPTQVFVSKKLTKWIHGYPREIEPSIDVLRRDLIYAKQSGIFDKLDV